MRDAASAPVLVATDLDASSDEAIREGHGRAASLGARLVVCHVVSAHAATAAVAYEALVERVRGETGRGSEAVETVLVEGSPAEAIVEEARRRGAGIIVIGAGRAHLAIGSTAGKVIRHAPCAVLVARAPVASSVVLAGTDFSDASYPGLQSGAAEARRIGGELVAIHVVPIEPIVESDVMGVSMLAMAPKITEELRHTAERRLAEVLAEQQLQGRVWVVGGLAGAEIVRVARELPARLVVVGTHGRTGLRRLLIGSVAEEVARAAPCSVLIERLAGAEGSQ